MSPSKRSQVSPNMPSRRHRGRASAKALRKAMARRRIEEMQEAASLRQQLYDVFADDSG